MAETQASEHARRRERRILLTGLTNGGAKVLTVGTAMISVPLTIGYLGAEQYGIWMTITSLSSLLCFADLGIGHGLLNAIAEMDGKGDRDGARKAVANALLVLSLVAVVLLAFVAVVIPIAPWGRLLNSPSGAVAGGVVPAVACYLCSVALNLPASIGQRIQAGFQEGYKNNLWQAAGSAIVLVGVCVCVARRLPLAYLVLVYSGTPVVIGAANALSQFYGSRSWIRPSWRDVDWRIARSLASTGGCFVVLNVSVLVGYSSDTLVIAHLFGPAAVACYSVVQKLFSATNISEFFIAPMWPAFGEALAKGDRAWLRSALRRSMMLNTAIAAVTTIPLVLFGETIVRLWVGRDVGITSALLVAFAAWRFLSIYQGNMSVLLNNGEMLRKQVWFFASAAALSLLFKIAFARYLGMPGVVWATIAAFGTVYAIPAAQLARRQLADAGTPEQEVAVAA